MKKKPLLLASFVMIVGASSALAMTPIAIRSVDFLKILALGIAIGAIIALLVSGKAR